MTVPLRSDDSRNNARWFLQRYSTGVGITNLFVLSTFLTSTSVCTPLVDDSNTISQILSAQSMVFLIKEIQLVTYLLHLLSSLTETDGDVPRHGKGKGQGEENNQ